jgi:hypothetical protein
VNYTTPTERNYYVHLNECKQAFGKIQGNFMIKIINKGCIKESYFNIIKTIHDKYTAKQKAENIIS